MCCLMLPKDQNKNRYLKGNVNIRTGLTRNKNKIQYQQLRKDNGTFSRISQSVKHLNVVILRDHYFFDFFQDDHEGKCRCEKVCKIASYFVLLGVVINKSEAVPKPQKHPKYERLVWEKSDVQKSISQLFIALKSLFFVCVHLFELDCYEQLIKICNFRKKVFF